MAKQPHLNLHNLYFNISMKQIFLAVVFAFAFGSAFAETKKVCHNKPGKTQQECKTIKTHKKLDSTKVENVKKK